MHSREQYTDSPPDPIARSAGIQVPQFTQRTNFLSVFAVEPLNASFGLGGALLIVFAVPRIFFKNWM